MKGLIYLGALVLGFASAGIGLFWPGHLAHGAGGAGVAVVVFILGTLL